MSKIRFLCGLVWIGVIPFAECADVLGPADGATIIINELLAVADPRFVDEDDEAADWLEILNRGSEMVSLSGWHLTDDVEVPGKWAFPAIDLAPGAFLVVYASGKDRMDPAGLLHTNFKLGNGGEYLALSSPDASQQHVLEFPKQREGLSYGLTANEVFRFFPEPTPGAANEGRGQCFVADTKFSVNRGFYDASFELEITCATPDVVIRYTTDGNEPFIGTLFGGAKGTVYDGPITIDKTTVLRAYATRVGWEPSNIDTQTYLFLQDVIRQSPDGEVPEGWPEGSVNSQRFDFGMDPEVVDDPEYADQMLAALRDIPSISLTLDHDDLTDPRDGIYTHAREDGRDWERPGSLELLNPDGEPGFHINAGVRIRGGFSRDSGNPKHSFRLFFRNEYGDSSLRYPLFGDEGPDEFKKFDFRTAQNYAWSISSSNDARRNTLLREIFARDSQRAMGQPYTRSRYYHLYLNGQYWGLYMSQERSTDDYAASYFGGEPEDFDVIKVEAGPYTVFATEGTIDAFDELHALVSGDVTDADFYALQGLDMQGEDDPSIIKHIDAVNLIDYMMTIFYVGSFDAPLAGNDRANNFYAIRSRETRDAWKFFSHDTEHSMLRANENRMGPYPAGTQKQHFNPQYLHQQLMQSDAYRLAFADRVRKEFFNGGVFTVDEARLRWNARRAEIELAIIGESARWGDQHENTPYTKVHWIEENLWVLNDFMEDRTEDVFDQMKFVGLTGDLKTPEFKPHGGVVDDPDGFRFKFSVGTLFAPQPGEIYYTLDGSDPKMFDGSVAPSANLYTSNGPGEVLDSTSTIRVRLVNEGQWSPINEATFILGGVLAAAENLVISEIMYNPIAPPGDSVFQKESDYEFVEFWNPSEDVVDLTGVRFEKGVHYTFPVFQLGPGQRAVLVHTQAAFEERYGNGVFVIGEYGGEEGGKLSNTGDRLTVLNIHGDVIADFSYNDNSDWPDAADGSGASLVRDDPASDAADPSSWRASPEPQGSPGEESGPAIESGYAVWKVANGVTDDLADPDKDGLGSFLEYATGGDPTMPTTSPLRLERESENLIFLVTQDSAVADVVVELESSGDLVSWIPVTDAELIDSEIDSQKRYRLPLSAPTQEMVAFRVRYRLAE